MTTCPEVVLVPVGAARTAISLAQVKELKVKFNEIFRCSGHYNLAVLCHGRFFTRDAVEDFRNFLAARGASGTQSDVFTFQTGNVRLIRLVGLGGLNDGCPPRQTMETLEEDGDTLLRVYGSFKGTF